MTNRKQYLAAIAAHVINGLPAPLNVDLCYGGDPEHLGITVDTIAEAREWLALDPKAFAYDYRYDPKEDHPHGFRIVGGNIPLLGVKLHIKACEDLPGPVGTDDETVLAFAAADVAPPAGDAVAAEVAAEAATAPGDEDVAALATAPVVGEHGLSIGRKGGPGDCGAECFCGLGWWGFDNLAEALALLDEHVANPDPRDAVDPFHVLPDGASDNTVHSGGEV